MIITCPNCRSQFKINPNVLQPDGKTVRCSDCSHEWFALPEVDDEGESRSGEASSKGRDDENVRDPTQDDFDVDDIFQDPKRNVDDEYDDIPEGIKPDSADSHSRGKSAATSSEVKARSFAIVLGIFLITFMALFFVQSTIINAWPPSAWVYKSLGVETVLKGEGLVFEWVSAEFDEAGQIGVSGNIINLTNEEKDIPVIEAEIINQAGDVLMQWAIQAPQDIIAKESNVDFQAVFKPDREIDMKAQESISVRLRFALQT